MIALDPIVIVSAIMLGGIVGSFVGAVVTRWPEGRSVVAGRSRCDSCDHVLGPTELIPVLSYVACRGRCRHCGAGIAVDQPLAEMGGVIVAFVVVASASTVPSALLTALFGWTLVALALLDWRHFWLPDALVLPLIPLGVLASLGTLSPSLIERLLGAGLGYGVLEVLRRLYRRTRGCDGLGAGDPKLLGATGAWLGVAALLWVVLAGAGLCLLGVAISHSRGRVVGQSDRLPLGTGLSLAAIMLIPFFR